MREEAGPRYLSPLVKQDLANLDSDGESRRLALKSLKQFIEQLDATSMPKFLSQIAESRESGASRSYAISLYEEVARVHRKLIKPHLPRVMSSVIRALAASGSSPQLQQACAKVTAAMARYTIDPTLSIEDAEDIIRAVCDPLTEALTGKLEPVAAGAAACIHALIETENWKYASDETVEAVCQRITVALSEKSTRTVIHLQLASALSSMNPDTLRLYGAALMRIAEDTLKTALDSWQHRKAAVKLLQGVLIILDKATLQTEVDLAIHALESSRLDKMPLVRAAVGEALYAAKMLASGDCGVQLSSSPLQCKLSTEQQNSWRIQRDMEHILISQSSWTKGSHRDSLSTNSPVQPKRVVSPTSQESNQLSFSPASTSTTESMHSDRHTIKSTTITRNRDHITSNSRRSLRQTQALIQGFSSRCSSPGTLSPSGSISDDGEFIIPRLKLEENIPARMTSCANGVLPSEEEFEVQGPQVLQVQTKATNLRVTMPLTDPILNLQDEFADDIIHTPESKDRKFYNTFADNSELVTVSDRAVPLYNYDVDCLTPRQMIQSPGVSAILDELTETAASSVELAEDVDDSRIEEARNSKPSYRKICGILPPRLREKSPDHHSQPTNSGACENSNQSFSRPDANDSSVESRDMNLAATDTTAEDSARREGSDEKSLRMNIDLKQHYNNYAFPHLDFSLEKPQSSTKDFLATPKRLMEPTLQSTNSGSNPDYSTTWASLNIEDDVALCQQDAGVVDMDHVEASSEEAGWSVRDNPIASDESFQADEELKLPFPEDHAQPIHNNFRITSSRTISSPSDHNSSESATHNKCEILSCALTFNSDELQSSQGGRILADHEIGMASTVGCCHRQVALILLSPERGHDPQSWWEGLGRFMLLRLMSKNNLCWCGEIILGGTLCVVLTLPLAMALVKALNSTPEHLVPT